MVYCSEIDYISEAANLQEKIARVDAIIDALLLRSVGAATKAHLEEYSVDSGQTKIRTLLRSPDDIAMAIQGFERIRQTYLSRLQGRVNIFIPYKNLR